MLYKYNYGFYYYAVDKYKRAYFRSISSRKVIDFINGQANKPLPEVIEILS